MVDRVVQVARHPGGRTTVFRATEAEILQSIIGPQGPPGIPGPSAATFTHVQSTPSASWPVTHNLGRFPSVTLIVNGEMILGDVSYTDLNSVLITWPEPTSGTAYVS